MKNYEIRNGRKKIYGIQEPDGRVRVMIDCDTVAQIGYFFFYVSEAQADELFSGNRRCIQDVLPDVPGFAREIFVTGDTPMEGLERSGVLPHSIEHPGQLVRLRALFKPFRSYYRFEDGLEPEWAGDAVAA